MSVLSCSCDRICKILKDNLIYFFNEKINLIFIIVCYFRIKNYRIDRLPLAVYGRSPTHEGFSGAIVYLYIKLVRKTDYKMKFLLVRDEFIVDTFDPYASGIKMKSFSYRQTGSANKSVVYFDMLNVMPCDSSVVLDRALI